LKELEVAFAGAEPPSLEDVLQLLNTVPTELLDYYAFIIQRIPRSFRWKTYALLESVVRARTQDELSVAYLWKTVMISDSPSYATAREIPGALDDGTPSVPEEEQRRALLLWGGGLVSLASLGVQLMHQTVHDFVTKLDFKDRVLGSLSFATHENGHCFHWKSKLTFHFSYDLAVEPLEEISIRASIKHGAEAEQTTGRSCQPFLDTVPDDVLADIGTKILSRLKKGGVYLSALFEPSLIRSRAAFATFFQLRLYLQDCVLLNPDYLSTIAPSTDLLRLVALAIGSGYMSPHQHPLSITNFLLDNGYETSGIWTLFPHVLKPEFRRAPECAKTDWSIQKRRDCLLAFGQLANLLLEHDQRCASRQVPLGVSDEFWVKPIHKAHPMTIRWLLDQGANPNELDFRGRTPIDHLLMIRFPEHPISMTKEDRYMIPDSYKRVYHSTLTLIRHGGQRRCASDRAWRDFVSGFRRQGFDVSGFPKLLPRIPTDGDTRPAVT